MGRKPETVQFYVWFDAHDELPDEQKPWADYVNYLQHRIFVGQAFWQSENGEFTNLKYDYLTEIVPKNVLGKLKRWLVGTKDEPVNEFIACDHRYWEGTAKRRGKCLGYRVAERFEANPVARVATRDDALADRIRRARRRDYQSFTKVMIRIRANILKVDIEFAAALELLAGYRFDAKDGYGAEDARRAMEKLLTIINDKSHAMPKRCDYNRLHHEFTRLARGFRRHLKVRGAKMVNIDVANSQPLFLYLAVVPFICEGGISEGDVSFLSEDCARRGDGQSVVGPSSACGSVGPEDESVPSSCTCPSVAEALTTCAFGCHDFPVLSDYSLPFSPSSAPISAPAPTPPSYTTPNEGEEETEETTVTKVTNESFLSKTTAQRIINRYPDLGHYRTLVEGGQLYQYLMKKIDWQGTKQAFKDECVFKFYYGPNNDRDEKGNHDPCKLKPIFEAEFPTVWAAIKGFKKARGWKELAREMQRREAAVLIDKVCVRIMNELPEAVFFPIHDSIMCEPQHRGAVQRIIMEEMARVGLRPTLGVTDYNVDESDEGVAEAA